MYSPRPTPDIIQMSKRSFSALLNTAVGLKTFHTVVKAIKFKHAFFRYSTASNMVATASGNCLCFRV